MWRKCVTLIVTDNFPRASGLILGRLRLRKLALCDGTPYAARRTKCLGTYLMLGKHAVIFTSSSSFQASAGGWWAWERAGTSSPSTLHPPTPHAYTQRSGVSLWRRYLPSILTGAPWGLLSSYTLSDPLLYNYVQCYVCHIRVNDEH